MLVGDDEKRLYWLRLLHWKRGMILMLFCSWSVLAREKVSSSERAAPRFFFCWVVAVSSVWVGGCLLRCGVGCVRVLLWFRCGVVDGEQMAASPAPGPNGLGALTVAFVCVVVVPLGGGVGGWLLCVFFAGVRYFSGVCFVAALALLGGGVVLLLSGGGWSLSVFFFWLAGWCVFFAF